MARQMILIFGMEEKRRQAQIMKALLPLRLPVRFIGADQEYKPLGVLAGWFSAEEAENKNSPETDRGESDTEEMLVMSGLSDAQIEKVLASVRKVGFGPLMKAILTPTNLSWDAITLRRELQKERASFQR